MAQTTLSSILQGGDRRSLGQANQLVALILSQPKRFPELLECLWSDDPVVRMRAADAAEKISAQRAELLHPFKAELLGLAGETSQQELRWHLALMIPRLPLTRAERKRAITLLKEFLTDRSSIVKTCALQGLAELAQGNSEIRSEVAGVVEEASRTGTPAMKARARKLLPELRR
jgi:HEAT repeat protein